MMFKRVMFDQEKEIETICRKETRNFCDLIKARRYDDKMYVLGKSGKLFGDYGGQG